MKYPFSVSILSLILTGLCSASATAADLSAVQQPWAVAMYQADKPARQEQLTSLADQIRAMVSANPKDPALLIWKGIIVSTLAGEQGGMGALGLAKEAKAALEESIKIDSTALSGSAHTNIGVLYHKVPGWPIAFGNDKKARAFLQQGLTQNPNGIDANYFMGMYLLEKRRFKQATEYLDKALNAEDRPGRELADSGRREEARALLAKAQNGGK